MRTFDEIAEAQGWDDQSQLSILRNYVASQQGGEEALADYAEQVAADENEEEL